MMSMDGVPTVQHAWGETPNVAFPPTGNYLASGLRKIYDDTSGIFPPSTYSAPSGRKDRWKSVMIKDFVVKDIREAYIRGDKPMTSLPIKDNDSRSTKKFMQWKIPHRLMNGDRNEGSPRASASRLSSPRKLPSHASTISEERQYTALPEIPNTSRMESRISTARTFTQPTPRLTPRTPSAPEKKTKTVIKKELLKTYADHDIPTKADQMLRYATPNQKQQIHKALKIADDCTKPIIVKDVVSKWVSNASERDRQVALDFFQSIAGAKLLGEDDVKAQQVVTQLKRGATSGSRHVPLPDRDEEARLRYIRLLTPDTRRQKEQFQTWHHLPQYRNENAVMNNSGIYNSTQSYVPRHFTIHPDWG